MMPGFDYLQIFSGVLSVVFSLWPLLLLAPLQRLSGTRRSRALSLGSILLWMLGMWAFLAVIRVLLVLSTLPILALFVREPLNTAIFVAVGGVLIVLKLGRDFWLRRDIRKKVDEASSVDDLRNLSPTDFENMVVELYTALGHKARRTGATGDHGIDVLVHANNGEKWIVQCKRWRGTVGEPIVRDFHGAMQHEKADKGAIITTGKFTAQARDWARGKPITLLEGDEFLKNLHRARQSVQGQHVDKAFPPVGAPKPLTSPICPRCGSRMVLRVARQGPNAGEQFWGCSTYPKCKGIVKYEPGM